MSIVKTNSKSAGKKWFRLRLAILLIILAAVAIFQIPNRYGEASWVPFYQRIRGRNTISGVVDKIRGKVMERLRPDMQRSGLDALTGKVALICLKEEKILEAWLKPQNGNWTLLKSYKFTGSSGGEGPKLKEGDQQIPEGVYRIEYLNPNSLFYLSMKIDYPNAFDRQKAGADGRTELGNNIFIHGSNATIGCIPVGNQNIEEVFFLVAENGIGNAKVILAPYDMRREQKNPVLSGISWSDELYRSIRAELEKFSAKP